VGLGRRWRVLAVVACASSGVGGACTSFESTASPPADDAGAEASDDTKPGDPPPPPAADSGADVAPDARCDAATAFGAPVFVSGIDVGAEEVSARLTTDELRIVFGSTRSGAAGTVHLYEAARPSTSASFVDAQALPGLYAGTVSDYWATSAPWTSTTLYFCSTRPSNLVDSIFSTSLTDAGTYAPPTQVTSLLNGTQQLCHPHVARHANEIWMSGSQTNADIYRARFLPDGGFEPPAVVAELSTTARDYQPVLSDDGLIIYWGSRRMDKNAGNADIWVATRSDTNAPFGNLRNVEELNSTADDVPSWLSPDACRLYMVSGRSTRYQLLVASRAP
jgi:hypothetical protein